MGSPLRPFLLLCLTLLGCFIVSEQSPAEEAKAYFPDRAEYLRLSPLNNAQLLERDRKDAGGGPFRFAEPREVKVTPSEYGVWKELENGDHGQLWTPPLPGDEVVVEVSLPAAVVSELELTLAWVNHGHVEIGGADKKNTALCHVDVACPVADPWRDEIRSVATYSLERHGEASFVWDRRPCVFRPGDSQPRAIRSQVESIFRIAPHEGSPHSEEI